MVVVVIITALAALAVPSILRQMRDRRTRQAAEEIASVYRQARLRALGRGAAVNEDAAELLGKTDKAREAELPEHPIAHNAPPYHQDPELYE